MKKSKPKTKGPRLQIKVKAGENIKSVAMDLKISKSLYNKTTDIAVTVKDSGGNIVARDAFGSPRTKVTWRHRGGEASYSRDRTWLYPRGSKEWKVNVQETQYLKEPIEFLGKGQDKIMAILMFQ